MLPFHDEPVICKNIIAKNPVASSSAKISYRENFRVAIRYFMGVRGLRYRSNIKVSGRLYYSAAELLLMI